MGALFLKGMTGALAPFSYLVFLVKKIFGYMFLVFVPVTHFKPSLMRKRTA